MDFLTTPILASILVPAVVAYLVWGIKRVQVKKDNMYNKQEVINLIDLKLSTIESELQQLRHNDSRIEIHLMRLEDKIDKLSDRIPH